MPIPHVSVVSSSPSSVQLARRLQIIAFGDSLTQQAAFPSERRLQPPHTVPAQSKTARPKLTVVCRADLYNRGYAGYTTRNALTTLRQHLRAGIWPYSAATASQSQSSTAVAGIERLVLLWLGTNDSCTHFTSLPNMHVPLAPFTANMRHIVHTLLSATAAHTLLPPASHTTKLLILTPLDQPHWQAYRRHKYSLPLSHPPAAALPAMPYVEAVKSVAAECDVAVCDVSTGGVLPADECGHWSVDGIHLNAEGNRRVYDAIVAAVERHWPELAVERLPLDGDAQIE